MKRLLAAAAAVFSSVALAFGLAPAAHAQTLPGSSIELPQIDEIPVPAPDFVPFDVLPPLPWPFAWIAPPRIEQPQYVASNWVIMGTGCFAPHEWAYTENGTRTWCSRRQYTDAYVWADRPGAVTSVPGGLDFTRATRVENSIGGRPCDAVGATRINPSNGQTAHCDWRRIVSDVPVWQFRIPPGANP